MLARLSSFVVLAMCVAVLCGMTACVGKDEAAGDKVPNGTGIPRIRMTADSVSLDGRKVMPTTRIREKYLAGPKLPDLEDELWAARNEWVCLHPMPETPFLMGRWLEDSRQIDLVVDESLPFATIMPVVLTAAGEGYTNVRLVVAGIEKAPVLIDLSTE